LTTRLIPLCSPRLAVCARLALLATPLLARRAGLRRRLVRTRRGGLARRLAVLAGSGRGLLSGVARAHLECAADARGRGFGRVSANRVQGCPLAGRAGIIPQSRAPRPGAIALRGGTPDRDGPRMRPERAGRERVLPRQALRRSACSVMRGARVVAVAILIGVRIGQALESAPALRTAGRR